MKYGYQQYIALLSNIEHSRWPPKGVLWLLLLVSFCWTCYWLVAEQRLGGELLLPILLTLWLLTWLFIRLAFQIQAPVELSTGSWRAKVALWWYLLKLHGTACLIFLLVCGCMVISLKLAMVVWRSFG